MTKKQIKKLANELAELELIHQQTSDKEEKSRVEKRIISITNRLISEPNGLTAMLEIDQLIQEKLLNNKGEN